MSAQSAQSTVLVLGVGHPDRGDDAVGPAVARLVTSLGMPDVRVHSPAEPSDLLDEMTDLDLVVVVDAVCTGAPPGTVVVREIRDGGLPEPGASGTHDLGLGAVVELARALGRLPRRLVLVGVEAASFDVGAALSLPVQAAVAKAAAEVVRQAASHVRGDH